MLLLLITMIGTVQSTTCNSFPKIFGGSLGDTWVNNIDVFDDYLAIAGGTSDSSLTEGIFSSIGIPYLALTSVSTGGKYYWVKALT